MRKKWGAILLAGIMLFTAACGSGAKTETAAGTSEQGTESKAAADGETVSFEWFLDASQLPQGWSGDQPIFQAITEATGCAPNITIPAADASTKLNLMISGGQLPDLISVTNSDGNMTLINDMIEAGLIWDMQEFAETYMPEDSQFLKNFPEDIKEAVTKRDGGWYCYPSHIISDDAAEIWGYPEPLKEYYDDLKYGSQFSIFFNKELIEKMGVDVNSINTEEKLLDFLEQVKTSGIKNESGADIYPIVMPPIDLYNTPALNFQFGALPFDEDGNYRSVYYDPNYRHAIAFLNKCYQKGYLDESLFTMDNATLVSLCNSTRAMVYAGGLSALGNHNDPLWCTPGPIQSSNGAKPVLGVETAVNKGWIQTVVKKDCKNPEAIAKFLDYMTSREGMMTHMYGIEGEDYYFDDQNMLHRTETGSSKVEDGVTGMFGFFAFHHSSFSRSVEYVDLSTVTGNNTALGASDKTFKYSTSLLEVPTSYVEPGSDYEFIHNEVITYVDSNLAKIILAKDDATFDTMFDEFLAKLDELRLPEYDEYINIKVQENCKEEGVHLTDGLSD